MENYRFRNFTDRFRKLFAAFPVVVISGARQVGKSTFLMQIMGEGKDYVVFDPSVDVENARSDPDFFLKNHDLPLVLDEVQYAPEVIGAVKRVVDKHKRPGMFVITGSQQWHVMKNLSESLAGRAAFLDIEGFSLSEKCLISDSKSWLDVWLDSMGEASLLDLEPFVCTRFLFDNIWRGSLPEADYISADVIGEFFRGYLRTYIERDIRLMADVYDWQVFGRFVKLVAALTAQEINYSHLGRDIGISPHTAKKWLALMEATFQYFEVPAFYSNHIKKLSSRPKGFIADTGFACHSFGISSPAVLANHPAFGFLFETFVAGEIRKKINLMSFKPNIYHWRFHSGAEIDLLLERDGMLFPIEVKVKSNPSKKDVLSFSVLKKTYKNLKVADGVVICSTDMPRRISENAIALPYNLT